MDLQDAGRRIFRRHLALILLWTVIGLAVPIAYQQLVGTDYVANARVSLGTDAHGGQESTSLGDTGLALATSPDVLTAAMKQAKVTRDLVTEAANVTVTPVGTSGVLQVSVTDSDAVASAVIANSLATQIVQLRAAATFGASDNLLAQLTQQSTALTQQIAAVVAAAKQTPYTVPGLQQQQSALLAQRSVIDSQRQQLAQSLALTARPSIIDASAKRGTAVLLPMNVLIPLGAVLGLVLGVAIAATVEAAAPTLDRATLAKYLEVPLLGRLSRRAARQVAPDAWLIDYVRVAAESSGVHTVQLVPIGGRPADATGLAEVLDRAIHGVRVTALQLPASRERGRQALPSGAELAGTGIVVVAREVVKSKFLAPLRLHLQVTRQPVIGLITYRGRLSGAAPGAHANEVFVEAGAEPRTGGEARTPETQPSVPSAATAR